LINIVGLDEGCWLDERLGRQGSTKGDSRTSLKDWVDTFPGGRDFEPVRRRSDFSPGLQTDRNAALRAFSWVERG